MLSFYKGNWPGQIPGNLPEPYYWWECGAMFGSLIDYWVFTGDATHNRIVMQGMQHQVGPNLDFMPPNQTKTLGNDDQCFWALSAMSAAEANFPNPPARLPQWLALAQAVFNTQVPRWDMATCDGGLKWQIYSFNNGFNYKNTISNGCFFNLGARLALYTGNQTYADWAEKSWQWMYGRGLISDSYQIYDGTDDTDNCGSINGNQWSYNAGILLNGAAAMYNYTKGEERWRLHTGSLLDSTAKTFFAQDIMVEPQCEPEGICNIDQLSFKAYLSRWLAATTKLAPWTYPTIKPLLAASAKGAMRQCSGGKTGRSCGIKWGDGEKWDGTEGIGQQMAALEVLQTNLIQDVPPPVTEKTGGTSESKPDAGSSSVNLAGVKHGPWPHVPALKDKAGAGVLTGCLCMLVIAVSAWMCWSIGE